MDFSKLNEKAIADYMQSTVRLDALEKMTSALDRELSDSQRMLAEMKAMFDSISTPTSEPVDDNLRHEDLSKLLEAGVPKLLIPDMNEGTVDVDLDTVVATMKGFAEDLKKNLTGTQSSEQGVPRDLSRLDLDQYASSLDQLGRRLANIKLSNKAEINSRNVELDDKLTQLCQDVNMFTQVVEAKRTVSEQNHNWPSTQESNALYYDNIVNKLLSGINEVTYLLKNKN